MKWVAKMENVFACRRLMACFARQIFHDPIFFSFFEPCVTFINTYVFAALICRNYKRLFLLKPAKMSPGELLSTFIVFRKHIWLVSID